MKRLLPFAPLLLLAALLLSPAAALAGAKQGLSLWWGQVFPALLPCFICVRLAQNLGLLSLAQKHTRGQLCAVAGFSLVSGAPNGAKLLYALVENGALLPQEGERLLPFVNNVSPAFLLSIIASELLKNKALFLPVAVAFYGAILCFLVPHMLCKAPPSPSLPPSTARRMPFADALSAAIEGSMLDMLRVGGCILFACTLLYLAKPLVRGEAARAALAGCMEISIGASAIAGLSLPLRLKASLLAGTCAFGGMSLTLQTVCCYPELRLVPYLLRKLLLGVLAGLVCYFLFPLFPRVSTAFASRQAVLQRSLSLSALFLSSAFSLAFIEVLSLMMASEKKS